MSPPTSSSSIVLFDRKDDEERGRQLVATQPIPKGRLIFCERPLVALQSLGNPVWVCHGCHAFVGGPHAALTILATQSLPTTIIPKTSIATAEDEQDNDEDEDEHDDQSSWKVVPCRHECGQVYCSTECEADFWEARHRFLCTGQIASVSSGEDEDEASQVQSQEQPQQQQQQQHPLIQFKQHAITTNEIFLLVAEWVVGEYTHSHPRRHVRQQASCSPSREQPQQDTTTTQTNTVLPGLEDDVFVGRVSP